MVSLLDYFNMGTMPSYGSETDIVGTDVYGSPIRRGPSLDWMRGAPVQDVQYVNPNAVRSPNLVDAAASIARRQAAAQPVPRVNEATEALAKGLNAGAAAGTAFAKNAEPSLISSALAPLGISDLIEFLLGISPAKGTMLNLTPEEKALFTPKEKREQAASQALQDDPSLNPPSTPILPGFDIASIAPPVQAPTPASPSVDDSGPGFFASIGEILRSPQVQYMLDVMSSPAFQDPRGVAAGIVGGAADVRAQRVAAAEKALELEQARRIEERRLRSEERDIERLNLERARLELAQQKQETPRAERATGPVIEAFAALAETDDVIRKIVDEADGTVLSRISGGSPSAEKIRIAIALEAVNVKNQNPQMSDVEAAREAARRVTSGSVSQSTTVAPSPKGPAGLGTATIKQ